MKQGVQLNQYGVPGYYTGKVPSRCSIVGCRKRKTLSKYPEQYRSWPKCECGNELTVDKLRLQGRFDKKLQEKDSGKKCTCDGIPYQHRAGQRFTDFACNFRHPDKLRQDRLDKLPPDDTRNYD